MQDFKIELKQHCLQLLQQKLNALEHEHAQVQASSAEDTKSSAGDKYETARAMADQEMAKLEARIQATRADMAVLQKTDATLTGAAVITGSLVDAGTALFYITISLGKVELQGRVVFLVSPQSPVGAALKGVTSGTTVTVNSTRYTVQAIY